jgi:Fe-S oxidoreductase
MTGLSAQRSWPTWQSDHFFSKQQPGVSKQEVLQSTKPVVLFVDTFNGFFESNNATAALGVLQAAGYSVHIASKDAPSGSQGHLCCGRTFLANGMVEQARQQAHELVNALLPFAQKGIAIVGLEPSCLLTLRDEALVLGLGASAELVSQHAVLFEEFLATENKAGKLDVLQQNLKSAEKDILLHGHCHQKAFGLMPSVLDVIKLIPKANPQLIESSCCGMAGSFGYEASHLDVSMQMAELSLLPAIRQQPDAIVVADGTSCRHQIADGAVREAIHVAQLLSDHLLRH